MGMTCRVVWAPDGQAVASASDDRSVMIWQLPEQAPGSAETGTSMMEAASVLTGHQARLWDAKFAGDLVVSASEDCTCRCVLSLHCPHVRDSHHGVKHMPTTTAKALPDTQKPPSCKVQIYWDL